MLTQLFVFSKSKNFTKFIININLYTFFLFYSKINRVIYNAQPTHAVLLDSTNNVGISFKTLKNDESPKM